MDFQGVRQYHGALLARGLYEWLLTGHMETVPPDGFIEPPILEVLASLSYLVLGGEHLWLSRLLSALFWVVGGVFLYRVAIRLVSPNAAVLSVAFYLFAPTILLASRAFMPDPMMIMLLVISIFSIVSYHEQPSTRRFVLAAVVSSLAVLVKPGICLFQVFGVFSSLAVYRQGLRKALFSSHLLLFTAFIVIPTGLYYFYGTFVAGFLQGQVQDKVMLKLLLRERFWQGWFHGAGNMMGYVALGGALLGCLSARAGLPRALLIGLWGGYVLYGMVFTFHIRTHDYYQLPLIPVVALSFGLGWDWVAGWLKRVSPGHHGRALVLTVSLLALVLGVLEHRTQILGVVQQGRGEAFPGEYVGHTVVADYEGRAATYREIGLAVHHSSHTIFLAPDWGWPLLYHGQLDGESGPSPGEKGTNKRGRSTPSAEARLKALRSELSPEYFIVIKRFTNYGEEENWESQDYKDLRRFVVKRFPVVAENDDYVVFDLRRKKDRGG